ncbi:hypothetical protein AB0B28_02170 [Glycomyces sp. NPDC046736]|uniref:hypothetical protein n=1 Tax=Glycomyces sp. NPDC046736 TaxID=3155615 RepID=UPI0033DFC765
MSDSSSEPYQGLDGATPAAGAPAFGAAPPAPPPPAPPSGPIVTLPGEYPEAPPFQPSDPIVTLPGEPEVCLPARMGCSNAECGNPTAHPAEVDWQRLVSAVPVEGQLYRLRPKEAGMSFPSETDFRSAVSAVRPEDPDAHAISRLREAWTGEVAGRLADWSERIKSNLTDLAEGWSGTDFEAFETACDQTRELVDDVIDDIDATVTNLQSTEETLYAIQGGDSGDIPYPAAQVWIDGDWHSWVSVHIRPAWWHGDCIEYTCQDAEHVLALGGAEPEMATEIIDYIDERVLHYVDFYSSPVNIDRDGLDPRGITVDEAKQLAIVDAMEQYSTQVTQAFTSYEGRQNEVNEDIGQRSTDTDGEERTMRTIRSDKDYPAVADPAYMDLEPPAMDPPHGTQSPLASDDPSLEPPAGEAPDTSDPVAPEEDDDDEVSGGLASGGPGFGGGGGMPGSLPSAPAATSTAGGVGPGAGMVGSAAVPAAAAGGAAAAAGSRGSAAMMGGAGGGMRGPGSSEQDREPDVDLVEHENMWGFVNEDDDPYA